MFQVFRLALANLRKRKGGTITLCIMVLVAAMLMDLGLTLLVRLGTFFDEKAAELNEPDFFSAYMDAQAADEAYHKLEKDAHFSYVERVRACLFLSATLNDESGTALSVCVTDFDEPHAMSPTALLESREAENPIYLSYRYRYANGYRLGDEFVLTVRNESVRYTVAGFYENLMFGATTNGIALAALPAAAFSALGEKFPETLGEVQGFRLAPGADHDEAEQLAAGGADVSISLRTARTGSKLFLTLLSAILVVFAFLMLAVALIVVRFQIVNSVEDGMANIGVLKALGYTGRQIRLSVLAQFLLVAAVAAAIGCALTYAVFPAIGGLLSASLGVRWKNAFVLWTALVSLAAVLALLALVACLTARRTSRITPLTALRGGLLTHSFKRDRAPLAASRLPLPAALAAKTVFAGLKQNVMVLVISLVLAFTGAYSVQLYYNMAVDNAAIYQMSGMEISDAMVWATDGADIERMYGEIASLPEVSYTVRQADFILSLPDGVLKGYACDEAERLRVQTVYEGRYPRYDNEAALSGLIAKKFGARVGDTFSFPTENGSVSFVITGLTQQIEQLGRVAWFTYGGFARLGVPAAKDALHVYLSGSSYAPFMAGLYERYGASVDGSDVRVAVEGFTSTFATSSSALVAAILAVTAVLICLILYLMLQTLERKNRRDYGVLKALGYRTAQLVAQMSLTFLPAIFLGVAAGCVLGATLCVPSMRLLLSGLGLYRIDFLITVPYVVYVGLAMFALAALVSVSVSLRVRRISPRSLIAE